MFRYAGKLVNQAAAADNSKIVNLHFSGYLGCVPEDNMIFQHAINIVGLRRRGFTNQQVFLIQDIYRTLYTRGLNNTEAIKAIETEYEASEERDLILNFIKTSERGIVRGSIDE